jgi:hypothetical protein
MGYTRGVPVEYTVSCLFTLGRNLVALAALIFNIVPPYAPSSRLWSFARSSQHMTQPGMVSISQFGPRLSFRWVY